MGQRAPSFPLIHYGSRLARQKAAASPVYVASSGIPMGPIWPSARRATQVLIA
jgi:hypothetical protein